MGGAFSCIHSGGTNDKTVKGNRPNDYTEIPDDFLTTGSPAASGDGDANTDGNIEELYENSSSIIRASNVELKEAEDAGTSKFKPSYGGKAMPQPPADAPKLKLTTASNGKKVNPNLQLVPRPRAEKAREVNPANGSKEAHDQAPAFRLGNPSEVGNYQNIQPMGLKNTKPLHSVVQQEPQEVGDVYAQVQKPKPKIVNGKSQQLNYIEVEFSKSSGNENNFVINNKSEQSPPTTYTDVIHKDGKIMLVSPTS